MALQLRPAILNEIQKTLNNTRTHLNAFDFSIEQLEGSILIGYNYADNMFITFEFSDEKERFTEEQKTTNVSMNTTTRKIQRTDYLISGRMAPGELTQEEKFEFYGINNIYTYVKRWVELLWDDLSANPAIRGINEQKKELDDFLKKFAFGKIPNADEPFSKEEIEDLKERLQKVAESLKEELKKSISDKDKLKTELNELRKEFDTFKRTIPNLSKKGWFKSTLTRIYTWGSKKENQKLIAATVNYGRNLISGE